MLVYQDYPIATDGEMLSLTDMWRAAGGQNGKRPAEWLRGKAAAEFVDYLGTAMGISHTALIRAGSGGTGGSGATWAHWQIGLAYAKYLSPAFHAWCNSVVRAHMQGEALRSAFPVPRSFAEALELAAQQQRQIDAQGERIVLLEAKSGSRPDKMAVLAYAKARGVTLSNGQMSRLSKLARQAGERHGRQPETVTDERWGSVLIHHVADLDAAWSFYFRPPVATDSNPAALPAPGARA